MKEGGKGAEAPRGRFIKRAETVAPALLLYAAIKIIGIAVLAVWSTANGKDFHELLSGRWDSLWYARIAEYGYGFTLDAPDGRSLSSMAFFPLLPWLEELGGLVGLAPGDAGLLVSAVSSIVAAAGLFHLGGLAHSPRAGTLLVCLWAALPVAIVQSMAYSESLFVALASWSLYALLKDRWTVAGILSCLAGLTRPVGMAVAAAILVAALPVLLTAWRERRQRGPRRATGPRQKAGLRQEAGPRQEGRLRRTAGPRREYGPGGAPGPWAGGARLADVLTGTLLAPLGATAYILWVGSRQGEFLGYLDVQKEWGNGFDGGKAFAEFITAPVGAPVVLTALVVLGLLALSLWTNWISWRQNRLLPLAVYSLIVTLLAVGASGYFGSKPRLLLPAFPLLIPLAVALATRAGRTTRYLTVSALVVISAVYGAFWLNGSGPP
ncbi:hypothetical protein ABT354_24170 [Streptomyces sp. NPDC000594]|uniref:hypothetical protein n=1 Tax=Streptomyces sp. NPDC000594 TaxID=3154261 RepID=UPI0033220C27